MIVPSGSNATPLQEKLKEWPRLRRQLSQNYRDLRKIKSCDFRKRTGQPGRSTPVWSPANITTHGPVEFHCRRTQLRRDDVSPLPSFGAHAV